MTKPRSDTLFLLIKSLSKNEKRYFKLKENGAESTKYLTLFKLIDQQKKFNDEVILTQDRSIQRSQYSNLKSHLYNKILKSLRNYSLQSNTDIQIRELIDESQILFNKSLYTQCSNRLNMALYLAQKVDNLESQLEILKLKRQVISHTSRPPSIDQIIQTVKNVNAQINNINQYTNLHSQLKSLYQKKGFIRNKIEFLEIKRIFNLNLTKINVQELSVSEKIYLYHLYIGYYFFIQDFESGHNYAKKWVDLFTQNTTLIRSKLELYISGLNYLLIAQYKLNKYHEFITTKKELRLLNKLPKTYYNDNIRLRMLKYSFVHEFNDLFMTGNFEHGIRLFERLSSGLQNFINQVDPHSRVIFFYKTACLYFGGSMYRKSLVWLNKILEIKDTDLREDIHGFARILILICHYELNNIELIPYHVRSTYRFLLKKKDMHKYQRLILAFLKGFNSNWSRQEMILKFETLRKKMILLQEDIYERRAFVYFDIVSWLESKIYLKSIQEIIQNKAIENREKKQLLFDKNHS